MTDDKRLWPRFSPEINFGHLLQAAVILVTIGGGAITSYLSLRSDIQQVRADLTVKVSEHELRLAAIERAADDQIQAAARIPDRNARFNRQDLRAADRPRVHSGRRHG